MVLTVYKEQSTAALNSLSESYSNLDTLLSSSRTLVSSLLRSQKSDTWYLETAFYILIGTIIWLVFRRLLYGPMWWLLWLPLKIFYRVTFSLLGVVGLASSAAQSTAVGNVVTPEVGATGTVQTIITDTPSVVPEITASMDAASTEGSPVSTAGRIMQEIEGLADQSQRGSQQEEQREQPRDPKDEEMNVEDKSPEERARQDAMPRNPKKRMWEENVDGDSKKDEL